MTDVVSVERLIPAPASEIFELLANPSRHRDIDGSGTVRDPKGDTDERLELGSQFGMSMVMGLPYSMRSTVVEFEPDRRIAWQTRGHGLGRNVGGRIWRYELEPAEGGTLVRESWDITQESALTKPLIRRAATSTARNMAATLERIEELLTGD
jgi:uncharacterized protein YndB with AHSA1/START domain